MTSDKKNSVSASGFSSRQGFTSTSSSDSEDGETETVVADIPMMGSLSDSNDSEPADIPNFDLINSDDNKAEQDEEQMKRDLERKEKNKLAARKSRDRRDKKLKKLTENKMILEEDNGRLMRKIRAVQSQILKMKRVLDSCSCGHHRHTLPGTYRSPRAADVKPHSLVKKHRRPAATVTMNVMPLRVQNPPGVATSAAGSIDYHNGLSYQTL